MRVVAGRYKGRRLTAPRRGTATRPTLDQVREAVFNILGSLEGVSVLDLYAGSGALGIEALSRGAADATFVDSDAAAIRAIRQNLDQIGDDAGCVVRADALAFLRGAASEGQKWDLVLCDPPYRLAHRLGEQLGSGVSKVLAPEARVVCESSFRQPLQLDLPLLRERRYGDTLISVYGAG